MNNRLRLTTAIFTGTLLCASASYAQSYPIELSIEAPGGSVLSADAEIKKGKIKDKSPNLPDLPILFEDGWTLSFRMSAPDAVGIVETRERLGFFGVDFDTLVLTDPDECFDLSHSFPLDYFPGRVFTPLETCPGGADETFVNFVIDEFEEPNIQDRSSICNEVIEARLTDDPFGSVDYTLSNKAYVDTDPTSATTGLRAVGVFTGGEASGDFSNQDPNDCYGYGADDDVPSLVVMANASGARVFDELLNFDNTRIRNMAGLVSGVSLELIDNGGATSLVAKMPVRPNMLRPLTYVDINDTIGFGPFSEPIVIKSKVEDGPVETIATLPGDSTEAELVQALFSAIPTDYIVEIRAVVVEGTAPEFITDVNGDGLFTADDLSAAGYTLLSNEDIQVVNLISSAALAAEQDAYECPVGPIYVDLDGDGAEGGCADGDGTSRSGVRRPR